MWPPLQTVVVCRQWQWQNVITNRHHLQHTNRHTRQPCCQDFDRRRSEQPSPTCKQDNKLTLVEHGHEAGRQREGHVKGHWESSTQREGAGKRACGGPAIQTNVSQRCGAWPEVCRGMYRLQARSIYGTLFCFHLVPDAFDSDDCDSVGGGGTSLHAPQLLKFIACAALQLRNNPEYDA